MASAARDSARAAFLPQVSAQAGWEFNGAQWDSRASGWLVGAVARVNLFQGLADRARLTEATEHSKRRALEREKTQSAVRLNRTALARLDEATAREAAGRASVAQARESQRIIRDRYESGLADVVSLLRAAEAVQEAIALKLPRRSTSCWPVPRSIARWGSEPHHAPLQIRDIRGRPVSNGRSVHRVLRSIAAHRRGGGLSRACPNGHDAMADSSTRSSRPEASSRRVRRRR